MRDSARQDRDPPAHVAFAVREPDDLALEQVIAARIALNPERRAWRHDIVISTAVSLLVGGDRTTEELLGVINRTLRTRALKTPELEAALSNAMAAQLVQKVRDLTDIERWQATPAAKAEASEDRAWAQEIYDRFQLQVAEALVAEDRPPPGTKVPRYAAHLLRALSAGSSSSFDVEQAAEGLLRPITFDRQAARGELASVEPRSARDALARLADDAMDVDDPFGNELVHLIVVSNLLHAMFTRSDVPAVIDLSDMRVLLDTSALLDLIVQGTAQRELLVRAIDLCAASCVQVVVGEHTIDEWDRLWGAALLENPSGYDGETIAPLTYRLVRSNPFITEYLRRKADDPQLTWRAFESEVRDLRQLLVKMPVTIRPCGNATPADHDTVDRALALLEAYSRDPEIRGQRTRNAARTDAESCAMLLRWRRRSRGAHQALFLANDTLTEKAFRELAGADRAPLTVNTVGLTAYLGALTTVDPEARAQIAEVVSTGFVRETFFGMATSYTLDEGFELARLLEENGVVRPEDAREALQLDFDALLKDANAASEHERVLAAGGEVIRRRSARRDARAVRLSRQAEDRQRAAEAKLRVAGSRAEAAERATAELQRELTESKRTPPAASSTNSSGWPATRLKRMIVAVFLVMLAGAVVAGLWAGGVLDETRSRLLAVAGCGAFAYFMFDSVVDDKPWWSAALAASGTAALLTLELILGAG